MGTLFRVLLLSGVVVATGLGGYWTIQHDLHAFFHTLWNDVMFFVKTFDISVVIRAAMVWVQKMGMHWLLIEVPKRILILTPLPYVILFLMPLKQRRRFRAWIARKRVSLLAMRARFMTWLRAEHMFGDYAGWAIGLILALIFFLFFYSAFWVYLALWLGFIKIPAIVTAFFSYFWGKLLFLAQKIPFANLLFKWVNIMWMWVLHTLGFKKSMEERRKLALRRRQRVIEKRYGLRSDYRLFRRVGWRKYRQIKREQKRQAAKAATKPKPQS